MKSSFLHHAILLGFFGVLCLPIATLAQTAPLSYRMESQALATGLHSSRPNDVATRVVYRTIIKVPGAPWLRLHFSDVELGANSYITVTSLFDQAQQDLDADALAQWQNTSAYFNGDALEITLHVAPGDQDVFVQMNEIMVGEQGESFTQCGPTDDRVPSSDARTGRLLSIGCTAWLIADGRFVSAGHCTASAGSTNTMQFNVPASLPSGTIQHPGPEDQYTVDDATIISVNGGVGNDWGVFGTFINTTTGLTAIQAQGAWFNLAQDLGPPTIRITGYGVDSGTANQTQQTHAGPNAGSSGTTMRYQTDTTGGNSGSPVIDDANNIAVGVHTHGGCSTGGGGNNNGTSTFNTAFWAEVGNVGGGLEVSCTPTSPPIVIPAAGGSYMYELAIVNNGSTSVTFDIWLDIDGPGVSRTRGPFTRTLTAGASLVRTLNQRIPGGAPTGDYVHTCNVGAFATAVDSDSFDWTKSPAFAPGGVSVADWSTGAEIAAALRAPARTENSTASLPDSAELIGAYPNPFNPTSTITYTLAERGQAELYVYNTLGQRVAVLASGVRDAGRYEVQFDASLLPSGVYMYTLRTEGELLTGRLMLVK